MGLNKAELIESIAAEAKISKADAKRALDAFVNNTTKALKKGDRVALVGFGTFSITKRAARKGRNPQTGKEIKIAAKKVVKFKAGADLSNKENLTLENVLLHQAGLVAYIPFYRETIDTLTGIPKPGYYQSAPDAVYSVPVAANMYMRKDYLDTINARILASPVGTTGKYIYSDNDFIFLGKIVEQIAGQTLDNLS